DDRLRHPNALPDLAILRPALRVGRPQSVQDEVAGPRRLALRVPFVVALAGAIGRRPAKHEDVIVEARGLILLLGGVLAGLRRGSTAVNIRFDEESVKTGEEQQGAEDDQTRFK